MKTGHDLPRVEKKQIKDFLEYECNFPPTKMVKTSCHFKVTPIIKTTSHIEVYIEQYLQNMIKYRWLITLERLVQGRSVVPKHG